MMRKMLKKIGRSIGLQGYSRLRRALDSLTSANGPPFFIQIGANNGIDFDDLYVAVIEHRMPGIAVEPIADYYESLRTAYARHGRITPIRAAIHPSASSMTMFRVDPARVTRTWEHGIASLDRNHLLKHGVGDDAIVEEQVPCLTFDQLLARVPEGEKVEVLAIDTEGFDAEILRMIDFTSFRPSIIRFEAAHIEPHDLSGWMSMLRSQGYRVRREGFDALAVHQSVALHPVARAAGALMRRSRRAATDPLSFADGRRR